MLCRDVGTYQRFTDVVLSRACYLRLFRGNDTDCITRFDIEPVTHKAICCAGAAMLEKFDTEQGH